MSVEEMKSTIRGVHEAIMKDDVEKLASFLTDDTTVTDPVGTLKGREGAKRWMKWISGNFPKVVLKETGLIVEGNLAAHEYTMEGTTTEKVTVSFPAVVMYEFKDGKILNVKNFYDQISIAKRLAKGVLAKKAVKSIEDQFKKGR